MNRYSANSVLADGYTIREHAAVALLAPRLRSQWQIDGQPVSRAQWFEETLRRLRAARTTSPSSSLATMQSSVRVDLSDRTSSAGTRHRSVRSSYSSASSLSTPPSSRLASHSPLPPAAQEQHVDTRRRSASASFSDPPPSRRRRRIEHPSNSNSNNSNSSTTTDTPTAVPARPKRAAAELASAVVHLDAQAQRDVQVLR